MPMRRKRRATKAREKTKHGRRDERNGGAHARKSENAFNESGSVGYFFVYHVIYLLCMHCLLS